MFFIFFDFFGVFGVDGALLVFSAKEDQHNSSLLNFDCEEFLFDPRISVHARFCHYFKLLEG
jgi:hypothetical protein